MNCYRVVIFDEHQKVLISKVVTSEEAMQTVAGRISVVIHMHHAPFTVNVTEYIHDSMSVLDFMARLNAALEQMSLGGG